MYLYRYSTLLFTLFALATYLKIINPTFIRTKLKSIASIILMKTLVKKQPQETFYKKRFLKTFAKFTGKHMC